MKNEKSFTEKTLEKIQSQGHGKNSNSKGKKTGRLIMVIDGIIIVLILLFFFGRDEERIYESATVNYAGIEYRLSLSGEKGDPELIFNLSIINRNKTSRRLVFKNKKWQISITSDGKLIHRVSSGGSQSRLILEPEEIHTETATVNRTKLSFKSGGSKKPGGFMSLLGRKEDKIYLNALAEIYLDNILTLKLKFLL